MNLSVNISSVDIMELCREVGALYIDTVVEPWDGFYFDSALGPEARTNYSLRETAVAAQVLCASAFFLPPGSYHVELAYSGAIFLAFKFWHLRQ